MDFASMMNNPLMGIANIRQALRASIYGRAGLVTVVQNGNSLEYLDVTTGKKSSDIEAIFNRLGNIGASEYSRITVGQVRSTTRELAGNKVGDLAGMLKNITNRIQRDRQGLIDLGFDSGFLDDFLSSGEIGIIGLRSEGKSGMARSAQAAIDDNLQGVKIFDAKGGRVVQFKAGDKMLTTEQAHILMAFSGNTVLSRAEFAPLMVGSDAALNVTKSLGKSYKRTKALLAEREISIAGDELDMFLTRGLRYGKGRLESHVLRDDVYKNILQRLLDNTADLGEGSAGTALNALYNEMNIGDTVYQETIGRLSSGARTALENELIGNKRTYEKSAKTLSSRALIEDFVSQSTNMTDTDKTLIKNLFSQIEKDFDGSHIMNQGYFQRYRADLKRRLSGVTDPLQRAQIERQLETVQFMLNSPEQLVSRHGYLSANNTPYQHKGATQIGRFIKDMEGYLVVARPEGINTQTALSGEFAGTKQLGDYLTISGVTKKSKMDVFANLPQISFHPELYNDPGTQAQIADLNRSVRAEITEFQQSGVLKSETVRNLRKTAEEVLDPNDVSPAKIRNKEFSRSIVDMIDRGIDIRNIPQAANMVMDQIIGSAYSVSDGAVMPLLKGAGRRAVDSEINVAGIRGVQQILGKGVSNSFDIQAGQEIAQGARFYEFRLVGNKVGSGKKMLFAPGVTERIYESQGGFDFDDKVLDRMVMFNEAHSVPGQRGRTRIAFDITRDPTGTEEMMLGRAKMDTQTIMSLLKGEDDIKTLIDDIASGTADLSGTRLGGELGSQGIQDMAKTLRTALFNTSQTRSGMVTDVIDPNIADDMEEFIAEMFIRSKGDQVRFLSDRRVRGIAELLADTNRAGVLGTVPLERLPGEASAPSFRNQVLTRIEAEAGKIDLSPELLEISRGREYSQVARDLLVSGGTDYESLLRTIGTNKDNAEIWAMFNQAFEMKQMKSIAANGESLGIFVNRSMVLGNFLGQFEDFRRSMQAAGNVDVLNYIEQNFRILTPVQENAIDFAVAAGDTMRLTAAVVTGVQNAGGDQQMLARILGEVGNFQSFADEVTDLSLNRLGERSLTFNNGRLLGFATSLDTSGGYGISELLYSEKVTKQDLQVQIEGVIKGINEAIQTNKVTDMDLVLERQNKLNEMLQDLDNARPKFIDMFKLSEHSIYNISNLNVKASYEQALEMKRAGVARAMSDPSLQRGYYESSQEARRVAAEIVERNKDDLLEAYNVIGGVTDLDQLSEIDRFKNEFRKIKAAENLFSDIIQSRGVNNVSRADLFTSVEYLLSSINSRIAPAGLAFTPGEAGAQVYAEMAEVRRLRSVEYMASLYDDTNTYLASAKSAIEAFRGSGESITEAARNLIKFSSSGTYGADPFYDAMITALADQDMGAFDENIAISARSEAAKVRNRIIFEEENVADQLLQLRASGVVADPAAAIGGAVDYELLDDLSRVASGFSQQPPVTSSPYKRITKSIASDIISKPGVKKGLLAAAILTAGSFLYSSSKDDRTAEQIQGPPLLPGGSAYEPMPTRQPNIGDYGYSQGGQGTSYSISLSGSRDKVDEFNQLLGGMNIGNNTTTMYDKIPDLSGTPLLNFMNYL